MIAAHQLHTNIVQIGSKDMHIDFNETLGLTRQQALYRAFTLVSSQLKKYVDVTFFSTDALSTHVPS